MVGVGLGAAVLVVGVRLGGCRLDVLAPELLARAGRRPRRPPGSPLQTDRPPVVGAAAETADPTTGSRSVATTCASGPCRILGLNEGEAHVIRNAGGLTTEDEIRSLATSV